jgi:hypothetical protein
MQTMQQSTMKKLAPVIMVDAIEPCVPFWERLGFAKTAEVPEGDRLGFVILAKDSVEVMYQTHESVQKDAAGLVPRAHGHGAGFFIEVSDIESVGPRTRRRGRRGAAAADVLRDGRDRRAGAGRPRRHVRAAHRLTGRGLGGVLAWALNG